MPESLFQHPRSTYLNYGKQRFLIESPLELPTMMDERIRTNLRQLHRHHMDKFTSAFELPHELHFIPLFENILYRQLVEYHNSNSTPNRFVHPSVFMLLSPEVKRYIPSSAGAKKPMESISEHEVKHWLEIESDKKKSGAQITCIYDLSWKKDPNGKFETLLAGSSINVKAHRHSPIISWAMGPDYPSSVDYKAMEIILPYLNKYDRLKYLVDIFLANKKKAIDQGLTIFQSPLNLDQARRAIYKDWRENNKDTIRMDVYPK